MKQPDFAAIREEVKAIIAKHGGKIEINEWNTGDDEVLKVLMTFKVCFPGPLSQVNLRTAAVLR